MSIILAQKTPASLESPCLYSGAMSMIVFDRSDTTKNIFGIAQVEILVKIWIWSFAEAVESWTESDQKS